MLGKIYDQGSLAVVYSPIIKTSKSGLFTNKRLAILSFKQAVLGYQSKLPDSCDTFQDINCARNCKESVNIIQEKTFTYYISQVDQTTLIIKCQQKIWEFKFQNFDIAKQWYGFIFEILNPPVSKAQSPQKQVEEQNKNLNFSKLKSASRFGNASPQPNQNTNPIQFILPNYKNETNKQPFASQQKSQIKKDKETQPQNRFRQFEKQYISGYESVKPSAPIITTFRERFPNNTIFKSVRKESATSSELESAQNWNIIWFEAIETQQQHVRIDIYNNFLKTCQSVCKEIHKQLTMLKQYRHYVPAKISAYEQIYNYKNVTYHLLLQKDIQNSEAELCSDFLLQQYKKLHENYTLILKATNNKGLIKVPLSCIFSYRGFNFFCEADIPSSFIEVDHSDKFIFNSQLQRLEQQIKVKINLSYIELYTNKVASIVESQINLKKIHFLIIKDIKRLLPEISFNGYSSFILSKDYFLRSNIIFPKDYDYREQKAKWISKFLKDQNNTCSIISYQDLNESLQKSCLTYSSVAELIPICQNRYLSKLFITEFVSQIFCHIIRTEMMIFVKKWNKDIDNMLKDEVPDYQTYIFQLLTEFLSESIQTNIRIWNIITNQIFQKLQIVVKMQEIILGYLLSSISLKIGINLDYQLLILQKNNFFNQGMLISPQALKQFEPLFIRFTDEDMCQSYEAMMIQIQNHEDQVTLTNIQRFYRFKQQNFHHLIEPYHWKKICKVFSYYVPYDQQQQYSYLSIYSCLNFLYFDYNSFCILVSAIKWLFHSKRVDDALQLVHVFIDVSWFWVSQGNPFLITLYQIVGEYYRITGNLLSSIEYISKCNEQSQKLVKGNFQLDNLDRNYKLAQIYINCNRHKQSLKKYLEVKRILRKTDKDSQRILNCLLQISKLYLHLGDIENCSKTCKQTLQFSTFNPFQKQQKQFQIYSILLRSLQIKEDFSKYKFYVDVIQQKFKNSNNPFILQNILRLSLQQILQKYNKYHLKKFCLVLYHFQNLVLPIDEELSMFQLFKRLIKRIGAQQPCKLLRYCMERHLEISDLIVQRQTSGEDIQNYQELINIQNLLSLFCRFIGFQFIFAHIVSNFQKN